ncbi:lysophospholipid acyltransferase family protein [Wenyingzhuangia sp. 2_MG-2023]|uniref:lysophospholipid acyltransferase family protein n=1 Tax=Wenyingzhuangia sp. 2_MG-2023 TaxID=3062639 RepID=UPI0026E29D42|nr:lipid A biosynthesis acyltransferase [Wenyingzhuangia sp. 2_MG-2023]MDO6737164.1 lipid A biosynthesis acyltransferase [Wenyingzhuangia sp. 2_MG-2023]MDO6801760.1 lipid A biosynthesis acyltransferase [Wenyingzhuangia sp. 1_MG-2023]
MNKDKLIFWILYPVIFLLSKLPLWFLYGVSNLLYYLFYYVIKYRRSTIRKNLKLCFPEKSDKERLIIEKKSFHHFLDIFIEMLKGFGIPQKEIDKRYKYINPEVFREIEGLNKSVILLGAHYGNWEWLFNINHHTSLQCYGAYKRLKNKHFDKYVKENRSRFGSNFVQTNDTIPQIISNYRKGIPSMYGLLSDQTPHISKTHYWAPFFGHTVPIHTGAEMLAKRFDFAVIYMHVAMPKRGYYEITFETLTTSPEKTEGYPLTDQYLRILEKDIAKCPELYFWTHKRFKYLGQAPKTEEPVA